MAKGLTDDANYQAIANAIRLKNGLPDKYTPKEMAAAITAIETGKVLDVLENQANAEHILIGYAAYNAEGEVITGEAEKGVVLKPLDNTAGAAQVLSGYQAYDANGNVITGAGELFESQAEFTLTADGWNGTTYTVTTNAWRVSDTATALMDLPYTSSSVNAARVVEAGITMPSVTTKSNTDSSTGITTYTTTIVFSARHTPPVDVDVAVFNLVEVGT